MQHNTLLHNFLVRPKPSKVAHNSGQRKGQQSMIFLTNQSIKFNILKNQTCIMKKRVDNCVFQKESREQVLVSYTLYSR